MKPICSVKKLVLVAGALLCSGSSLAVDYLYLLGLVPKAQDSITAYGTDLFGDTVNLYDGSLAFEHTDLSVPGNNNLPVQLTRGSSPGKAELAAHMNHQLADWSLKLPRIGGTFAEPTGWRGWDGSFSRCSKYRQPEFEFLGLGVDTIIDVSPDAFWHGNHIEVPGHGSQELLRRLAPFTLQPSPPAGVQLAGSVAFPLVTKRMWQIGCLPTLLNGAGEGFVAISPEGTRYEFNWLVEREADAVRFVRGSLRRKDVHLHATRVVDRFGNWVNYNYQAGTSGQLASITSSDGRSISLTYSAGRLVSATDGTRTVNYSYAANGTLWKVTLPGNREWVFDLRGLVPNRFEFVLSPEGSCEDAAYLMREDVHHGSIKHPTGAIASFRTQYVLLHKSNVPYSCYLVDGRYRLTYMPNEVNVALTQKRITGAGLPDMTWGFAYDGTENTRITVVSEPDGSITRHHHGNVWMGNEGLLLKVEKGWSPSGSLQTVTNSYRTWHGGQPFPEQFGWGYLEERGQFYASRNVPLESVTFSQQGKSFTWKATAFDALARPVTVVKSGPGGSRTETTQYYASSSSTLSPYVVGPVASVSSSGSVIEATDFDPQTVLPTQRREFGVIKANFTYHTNGQLRTRSLGNTTNQILTESYHRGIPTRITYPTGALETAQVNNIGKITSYTSPAGYTTGLEYDAAWHLRRLVPPASFNPTLLDFSKTALAAYGIAAGNWKLTVDKGRARTETFFDTLWRPLLTRTFDRDAEAATLKAVVKRYDVAGRLAFESYPLSNVSDVAATSIPGRLMRYDALGRQLSVTVDSELGKLETRTTPLTQDFGVAVRKPNGNVSVIKYWALERPDTDLVSEHLLSETLLPTNKVVIVRDAFGKATSVARGGVTRRYRYDSGQRLCKTEEPEVGSTVMDYDAAGNVAWRASGLALPGTACDRASVPAAAKISFEYDGVNQLRFTRYGDGSAEVERTYTSDGLLASVRSAGTLWTYSYNALRALENETLVFGGQTFAFARSFNTNGDLSVQGYPAGGPSLALAPNALVEPTRVGSFATEVTFHPNGAVGGFKYGNGSVHSTSLNARGLPLRVQDTGVLSDVHKYDLNGNLTSITSEQGVGFSRGMTYDAIDRLASVSAPGEWGVATYTYDAADNLLTAHVGSRLVTLQYDTSNRLTRIVQNGSSVASGYEAISNLGYDSRGNISSREGRTYRFDIGNRLSWTSQGGQYLYDGHGRRVRVQSTDGSTRLQVYTQDGKLMWSTSTGGGRPSSSTAYIHLGGRQIAEWDSVRGTRYMHTDVLGSPVARTGASNTAVLHSTRFEAFGRVSSGAQPGPVVGLTGFTGHVHDQETGLVYMQQRYYDPLVGRFLSVDPVTTDADTGDSFNRYMYGNNSPYNFRDPDGRHPVLWGVAVVVARAVATVAGRIAGAARAAARNERQQDPKQRGRESEDRVLKDLGKEKNTTAVEADGKKSIPDFQDSKQVGEIKDTKRVTDTEQIRTQRDAARAEGKEHIVVTGTKTDVSAPVQENSKVIRRPDLGPK